MFGVKCDLSKFKGKWEEENFQVANTDSYIENDLKNGIPPGERYWGKCVLVFIGLYNFFLNGSNNCMFIC